MNPFELNHDRHRRARAGRASTVAWLLAALAGPAAAQATTLAVLHETTLALPLGEQTERRWTHHAQNRVSVGGRSFELATVRTQDAPGLDAEVQLIEIDPATLQPLPQAWRATLTAPGGWASPALLAAGGDGVVAVVSQRDGEFSHRCEATRHALDGRRAWSRSDGGACRAVAADGGDLWIIRAGRLWRLDLATGADLRDVAPWSEAEAADLHPSGGGFFWIAPGAVGFTSAQGEPVFRDELPPGESVSGTAPDGAGNLWALLNDGGAPRLRRYGPAGVVSTRDLPGGFPEHFAASGERVAWVARSGTVQTTYSVSGDGPVQSLDPLPPGDPFATSVAVEADGRVVVMHDAFLATPRRIDVHRWTPGADRVPLRTILGTAVGLAQVLDANGRALVVSQPGTLAALVSPVDGGPLDPWRADRAGLLPAGLRLRDEGHGVAWYPRTVAPFSADGAPADALREAQRVAAAEALADGGTVVARADGTLLRYAPGGGASWTRATGIECPDMVATGAGLVAVEGNDPQAGGGRISLYDADGERSYTWTGNISPDLWRSRGALYNSGPGFITRLASSGPAWGSVLGAAFPRAAVLDPGTDATLLLARVPNAFDARAWSIAADGTATDLGRTLGGTPDALARCEDGDLLVSITVAATGATELLRVSTRAGAPPIRRTPLPPVHALLCLPGGAALAVTADGPNRHDTRLRLLAPDGRERASLARAAGLYDPGGGAPVRPLAELAVAAPGVVAWAGVARRPGQSLGAVVTLVDVSDFGFADGFE